MRNAVKAAIQSKPAVSFNLRSEIMAGQFLVERVTRNHMQCIGIGFVLTMVMRHRQLGTVGLVMGRIPSAWWWRHSGLLGYNKPSLAKFSLPSI